MKQAAEDVSSSMHAASLAAEQTSQKVFSLHGAAKDEVVSVAASSKEGLRKTAD